MVYDSAAVLTQSQSIEVDLAVDVPLLADLSQSQILDDLLLTEEGWKGTCLIENCVIDSTDHKGNLV